MTKKQEIFEKKIYSKIDSISRSIHDRVEEVLGQFAKDQISEKDAERIINSYAKTLTASAIGTIKLYKWRMKN